MAMHTAWLSTAACVLALFISATAAAAQTAVKPPKNRYTPEQDVTMGREGAAEVRRQFPVIVDEKIVGYLKALGDRLVAVAPPDLNLPIYEYSFTPVNVKEINAFALPGGPMFVHRGMFDAAAAEGEVVGVMAHELAHVLLRHGTANASKAQNPWLQLGQLAGAIGGGLVGGQAGSAIAQGSQAGLGAMLLRYSRDFEKQADLLGAQIMARAGYDPRQLARMFETIERESTASGGSRSPQWMSSHPNPGNRTIYITKEAETLQIASAADSSGFEPIKSSFASLPAAVSMRDVEKGNASAAQRAAPSAGTPGKPVAPPSARYRDVSGGNLFRAVVPTEWVSVPGSTSLKVVPQNGYGQLNGQTVFTYGIEFGVIKATSRDLKESTDAWLQAVIQHNPQLRAAGAQQAVRISDRPALATPLVNASPLGGQERISLHTTLLANGALFYYLTIVQEGDAPAFEEAFRRVGESIRLADAK